MTLVAPLEGQYSNDFTWEVLESPSDIYASIGLPGVPVVLSLQTALRSPERQLELLKALVPGK